MEKITDEEIVKNQDIYIYQLINNFLCEKYKDNNIVLNFEDQKDLHNRLANSEELLKNLSTENLFALLMNYRKEDQTQLIEKASKVFENKIERDDFYCRNMEFPKIFLFSKDIYSQFRNFNNNFTKDTIEKMKANVVNRLNQLPDDKYIFLKGSINLFMTANFLKNEKEGIINTPEKNQVLNDLYKSNPDVFKKINYEIFRDDIFNIGSEFIKHLANFPNESFLLSYLDDKNPNVVKAISSKIKEYGDDWKRKTGLISDIINSAAINIEYLSQIHEDFDIEDFINYTILNKNFIRKNINVNYGPNYINEYETIFNQKYEEIDKTDSHFKSSGDYLEKKELYFMKKFGMDLNTFNNYYQTYLQDYENFDIDEDTKKLIQEMISSYMLDDEEKLNMLFKNTHIDKNIISKIESTKEQIEYKSKTQLSEKLNKTLDTFQQKIQNGEFVEQEINGQKIKIITLNKNFCMLTHSTNSNFIVAYDDKTTQEEIDTNLDKDYNNLYNNHVESTTYIDDNFMGLVPVDKYGIRSGYVNVKEKDIIAAGNYDINTYTTGFNIGAISPSYVSAKKYPFNCRQAYGEVSTTSKPDFLVIYDDDKKEVINNSLKIASKYGIPIVYQDKKVIEKNQISRLDNLIEEYGKTEDINSLTKIINTYETNRAGWLLNRDREFEREDEKKIFHSHLTEKEYNNNRFEQDFNNERNKIIELVDRFLMKENINPQEVAYLRDSFIQEKSYYDEKRSDLITKTTPSINFESYINKMNDVLKSQGREDLVYDDSKVLEKEKLITERNHISQFRKLIKDGIERVSQREIYIAQKELGIENVKSKSELSHELY